VEARCAVGKLEGNDYIWTPSISFFFLTRELFAGKASLPTHIPYHQRQEDRTQHKGDHIHHELRRTYRQEGQREEREGDKKHT